MVEGGYGPYLRVAIEAARQAGEVLVQHLGRVTARMKGPGDPVTDADLASQRLIGKILLEHFSDHTLMAEEEGVRPDPARPWRWIVDPLDGTVNYAHGLPIWCVSIALEHEGELVVGVVHHPPLGLLYAGAVGVGAGADCNGKPLKVSTVGTLDSSLIATGMPTDFAADADRLMAYMRRFSSHTHSVRRTGSSAWNLALLASGAIDVCYATAMNPWDAAAGVVLVREAGGYVTGLDGGHYNPYTPHILATNRRVHGEALDALKSAWPAQG